MSQEHLQAEILKLTEKALEQNPTIQRGEYSIESSIAELQIQKGNFDYQLYANSSLNQSQYRLFNADPRNQYLNGNLNNSLGNVKAGIQRQFRSSLLADLNVGYNLNNTNYPVNRFGEVISNYDNSVDHASSISLSITQPLLRGKGKEIATAYEEIQKLYAENQKENFAFINSYEILQVSLAYWSYLRANQDLEVYKNNEARVKRVLDITDELIKADKKPASALVQVNADLASQKRLTQVAERNLYNAKMNLGLVMGLNEQESEKIQTPQSPFPTIETSLYENNIGLEAFIKLAIENRKDIQAAKLNNEMAQINLKVAENNIKPQLDASLTLGYGSEAMGGGLGSSFQSLVNDEGRNLAAGVGVTYSIPIRNNRAKGELLRNKVQISDLAVVNQNLERTISIQISASVNDLNKSVSIYRRAKEALDWNKQAYENEQIKFQNGLTTLLNLILFQERLTYAELEFISAQEDFARSIVSLRHLTGTLIQENISGQNFSVSEENFYTLPLKP